MYRLLQITFLFCISFSGYSQKDKNEIVFIDSLGNKIESNESYFEFKSGNKSDSIKLENLYDNAYTKAVSINCFQAFSTNLIVKDSSLNTEDTSLGYCVKCMKDEIMIVDSIDINQDGIKELFLRRKWNCSAKPPVPKPYGVGNQWQNYSQYEVWDIKNKQQLFQVKNVSKGGVTISVNDGRSYGYSFKVEIDKKGSFSLSEFHGVGSGFEIGKYVYDIEMERYRKE